MIVMVIDKQNNIDNLEYKILQDIVNKQNRELKGSWKYNIFWWLIWKYIEWNISIIWIYAKKNSRLQYYVDNHNKFLFSPELIYEDLKNNYEIYLNKLWYTFDKNKWVTYIINIKTWKEILQESLRYYKIFETLSNVDKRIFIVSKLLKLDEILNKFKSIWKEKTWKDKELNEQYKNDFLEIAKAVTDKYIEKAIKLSVIKPVEIYLFLKYWVITDQETKKYLKQTLTFEYLSNLINNQAIDLVWEQGSIPVTLDWKTYKITFWPITKQELDYYKAKNWINEKMYEELLKILEEHKKLEERKKKEEEKHKEATKKEVSGLKGEVEK